MNSYGFLFAILWGFLLSCFLWIVILDVCLDTTKHSKAKVIGPRRWIKPIILRNPKTNKFLLGKKHTFSDSIYSQHVSNFYQNHSCNVLENIVDSSEFPGTPYAQFRFHVCIIYVFLEFTIHSGTISKKKQSYKSIMFLVLLAFIRHSICVRRSVHSTKGQYL